MSSHAMWLTALALGALLATPLPGSAQLRLARIYSEGMVLQRDVPVPVWGWAGAGESVTVTFDGRTYAARADGTGRWQVRLRAHGAGGPFALHVAGPSGSLDVRDLLVGDVWVCSGQSNMEFELASARHGGEDAAAAHDSLLRQFKVPRGWADSPAVELPGGAWAPADPAHAGAFTAVGYYFARALRQRENVPIGLINTTWGGSRIEAWMSGPSQHLDGVALQAMLDKARAHDREVAHTLEQKIGSLPKEDAGLVAGKAVWAEPALDDAQWATLPVPGFWEQQGYDGLDGVTWYRTTFDLSEAEAAEDITLGLGMIDDNDISYLNGQEIGRTDGYNRPRAYRVPASALHAGRNVLAVRVFDGGQGGGMYGPASQVYLETSAGRRPLPGEWKFKVGQVLRGLANAQNQTPTLLYNSMVYPLLPFPVKGVIWYQGESNADRPTDAIAYREQFKSMIQDWRRAWDRPELPFLWVQLPNFQQPQVDPNAASNWALLRESQTAALALPRTGQAVIIDLGEAEDIHPKNKLDVGNRLALVGRRVAYGERVLDSGPTFRAMRIDGGRVIVDLDHVAGGLKTRAADGQVHGFAIAGADRRWAWAGARLEGGHVVVWSDQVPQPVAVRYAWADNPDKADLYNQEGLPAAPFRTDSW
jgi:sialate O-acetylesterase